MKFNFHYFSKLKEDFCLKTPFHIGGSVINLPFIIYPPDLLQRRRVAEGKQQVHVIISGDGGGWTVTDRVRLKPV